MDLLPFQALESHSYELWKELSKGMQETALYLEDKLVEVRVLLEDQDATVEEVVQTLERPRRLNHRERIHSIELNLHQIGHPIHRTLAIHLQQTHQHPLVELDSTLLSPQMQPRFLQLPRASFLQRLPLSHLSLHPPIRHSSNDSRMSSLSVSTIAQFASHPSPKPPQFTPARPATPPFICLASRNGPVEVVSNLPNEQQHSHLEIPVVLSYQTTVESGVVQRVKHRQQRFPKLIPASVLESSILHYDYRLHLIRAENSALEQDRQDVHMSVFFRVTQDRALPARLC